MLLRSSVYLTTNARLKMSKSTAEKLTQVQEENEALILAR